VILPQKCPQNLSSWIVVFVASHLCYRKSAKNKNAASGPN
jgi:hypothetical protein